MFQLFGKIFSIKPHKSNLINPVLTNVQEASHSPKHLPHIKYNTE